MTKKVKRERSELPQAGLGPLPGQVPLPLPRKQLPTQPRCGWEYRGHLGYYGGVWVCERCGSVYASYLQLMVSPTCAEVRAAVRDAFPGLSDGRVTSEPQSGRGP